MSSAICQNFVQNAWKKELCSNCFKSKDEHATKSKLKPVPATTNKKVESIIKKPNKFKPKQTVCFPNELTEIIGFGGEDWASENEEEEDTNDSEDSENSEEDSVTESDDEIKELKRITKENTDFNTTGLAEVEPKKTFTQLLLGQPVLDKDGKKQTLLVSVTPFGEETTSKKISKSSHIPISKATREVAVADTKTNVVLKSYTKNDEHKMEMEEKSLLDEISETLEKGKNPIQIMARKKIQKEIVLTVSKSDCNKENEGENSTDSKTIKENNQVDSKQKSNIPEKRVSLTRTPALIKKDNEKPVQYQTSTAKIELLNTKNLKLNKETVNNNNKAKSEVNNNEKTDSIEKPIEQKDSTVGISNFIKAEIKSNEQQQITLDQESSPNETDEVNNNKATKNNISDLCESKEKKDEINSNMAEKTTLERKEKVVGLPPPVPKYTNMIFPQSRELAGEPDGRADPEVINELPALPLTPPPVMEVQSSFLHANHSLYEKPKIPNKPATVLIRKPVNPNQQIVPAQTLTTFCSDPKLKEEKMALCKQDSFDSDLSVKGINKRRAPKPPEDNGIYARHSSSSITGDSPVVSTIFLTPAGCISKQYFFRYVKRKRGNVLLPVPQKYTEYVTVHKVNRSTALYQNPLQENLYLFLLTV